MLKSFLNTTWIFLLTSSYINIFWKKLSFYLFLLDSKLKFYFFVAFQLLYSNTFVLTFIMEIFYFILAWTGLKIIKLKKKGFFLPTLDKSSMQNNPLKHLCLIFHKTVNTNKQKDSKFQSNRLSSFWANKKTVTEMEGEVALNLFCPYHYFCL